MDIFSAQRLSDSLRPRADGETVNVHVVSLPRDLSPDFDAMKKLIAGEFVDERREPGREERKVPPEK